MIKNAYIKKLPNGKYRVYSEKGKHMGTYDSMAAAKKRLQQIEFFKRKSDLLLDLNKLADYLDDVGIFKEANVIDQLTKQAAGLSPEEYERYYGKSKYEGSTIEKELDISTPEGYKKYYGRPKSEKSIDPKQTEEALKSNQNSLSNIIQDMAAILQDEDYGYGGGPGGYQKIEIMSGTDAATGILKFGNIATSTGFLIALKDIGFSPSHTPHHGADKMYSASGDMKHGGKIMVYRSSVPRSVTMTIFPHAPENEKYRDIVSAMRLMRFYLDFS